MDRFYWNYVTPEGFTDMVMYSDGRFLTGLVFEKSSDGFRNRWDKRKNKTAVERNCTDAAGQTCTENYANMTEQTCTVNYADAARQICAGNYTDLVGQTCTENYANMVGQICTENHLSQGFSENQMQNFGMEKELLPVFEDTILWLDQYFGKDLETGEFTGESAWPDFVPAMKIEGLTPFRRKVITAMISIPYGQTMTYGEIAKAMGKQKMSARAVGGAVGWNPICLIIPCHRVLGTNGSITGYGGGIKNKMALLKLEGIML